MAKKIQIDIEVNGKMQKVTMSAKKLRKQLDAIDGAQTDVSKSSRDASRNMQGLSKRTSNTTKEFSKMQQGMGGIVGVYATIAAQVFAVSAAFQFLKDASDVSNLIAGQKALGAVTGVAYQTITQSVRDATLGQLSFAEASRATAIGMASGLSPTQLEGLAKAAKNASITLGRDLTDSFNRLVRGTTKAEPELLDELGIVLRLDTALGKYADSIGVAVSELSAFQRSQAVANEVLSQAEDKFGAVEEILDPSVASLNRFINSFDNLINTLKVGLIDNLRPVFDFLSENTAALVGALTLFALPILRTILPNFKKWEETATATFDEQQKGLKALNDEIKSYEIDLKKASKTQQDFEKETAAAAKRAVKDSKTKMTRGEQSGMMFLTGQGKQDRIAAANAKKILDNAEAQLAQSAERRTGILRKMNADQLADMRASYDLRMAIIEEQNLGLITEAEKIELMEKKKEAETKARSGRMGRFMTTAAKNIARGINAAFMAAGILGLISMVFSLGQELYNALFPASEEMKKLQAELDSTTDKFETLAAEVGRMGDALASDKVRLLDKVVLLGNAANSTNIKQLVDELILLQAAAADTDANTQAVQGAFNNLLGEISDLSPELGRLAKEYAKGGNGQEEAGKRLKKYTERLIESGQAVKQLPAATEAVTREINKLAEATKEVTSLSALGRATQEQATKSAAQVAGAETALKIQRESLQLDKEQAEVLRKKIKSAGGGRRGIRDSRVARSELSELEKTIQTRETAIRQGKNELDSYKAANQLKQDFNNLIQTAIDSEKEAFDAANAKQAKSNELRNAGLTLQGKLDNITSGILATEVKRDKLLAAQNITKKAIELAEESSLASAKEAIPNLRQQLEADKLATAEAERQVKIDREKGALQRALLPIQEKQFALSADTAVLNAQQQINKQLQDEIKARKQILDLVLDQEKTSFELEARIKKQENPFFNEERFLAEKNLAFAQKMAVEKGKILTQEKDAQLAAIDLEEKMLKLQREGVALQLELLAAQIEFANEDGKYNDLLARVSAQVEQTRASAKNISLDFKRDLVKAKTAAEETNLQNAITDAELTLKALDPLQRVMEASADAFRTGLTDGINGAFTALADGTKTVGEALKDAAKSMLQTIQKEITQRMIVDPLIDGLLGEDKNGPTAVAAAHTNGATAIANAIGTASSTATSNQKQALNTANNNMKTTFSTGATQLKTAIVEALNSGIHLKCCDDEPTPPPPDPTSIAENPSQAVNEALGGGVAGQGSGAVTTESSGGGAQLVKASDPAGTMEEVVVRAPAIKGLKGSFNNFLGDFADIFDKNAEGGFMEKLGRAFESGGGIFSSLFEGLGPMLSNLFGGLFGGAGQGGSFGGMLGSAIGSAFGGPIGGAIGGALGGLLGFADGGYTKKISGYSAGGIAKGPRSGYPAMLHGNEAVVPLPDGKTIPVAMKGGMGQQNNVTVNVSIDNQGQAQSSTRSSSQEGANLGNLVAGAVQRELQNQKRSGGILNPYGVS